MLSGALRGNILAVIPAVIAGRTPSVLVQLSSAQRNSERALSLSPGQPPHQRQDYYHAAARRRAATRSAGPCRAAAAFVAWRLGFGPQVGLGRLGGGVAGNGLGLR